MDRFNALGRGMQIMFVGAVLLFIDLFFRWQEIEFDLGPLGDQSAGVSAWDNFLGIVLGLLTIALIAWIVLQLAAVEIPLPVSAAMVAAALGGLILLVAILKNLTDDYSTIWSYVGVVLAAVIAFGAWQVIEAGGGVDTLRSEMPRRAATSSPTAESPPMTSAPPPVVEPEAAPREYSATTEPESEAMAEPDIAPDEPGTTAGDEHDHPHDHDHPHEDRTT
ncbi:MAG: hypothetical protein M3364_04890 [Actinomycetota bacterium]|nr:hypothetical protein [Actinomycetota bacterium]